MKSKKPEEAVNLFLICELQFFHYFSCTYIVCLIKAQVEFYDRKSFPEKAGIKPFPGGCFFKRRTTCFSTVCGV